MKIYTNTFDLRQPSEKKFWVAPHSDFKIGIKVIGNKPIQYTKDIWLFIGNTRIDKDSEDNDFTYFKIKSGDTGEVKYTIVVIDGNIKLGYFTLTQVVTDSTVYEQESSGEIPSDLDVTNLTAADSVETKYLRATDIEFPKDGCNNEPVAKIDQNGKAKFTRMIAGGNGYPYSDFGVNIDNYGCEKNGIYVGYPDENQPVFQLVHTGPGNTLKSTISLCPAEGFNWDNMLNNNYSDINLALTPVKCIDGCTVWALAARLNNLV